MANVAGIPVWREMGGSSPLKCRGGERVRTLIVGAGPVGLALALDLGRRGHPVVVLNRLDFIAAGSKAICFSKRTLDIFDRLQVGDSLVETGVTWNVGKVFWGAAEEPIFQFDMRSVRDQKRPGFVNIQQYLVEGRLVDALRNLPNVELRWGHEIVALDQRDDAARAAVRTAEGDYRIDAEWIIACDGSRSPVRNLLGLDFEGRVFEDNFLIADVRMRGERPSERWFWFDPPFNPGQSALLHKQPADVWRLDFQLGWNIDREACTRPENVEPLVRGMLGEHVEFTEEWYSVYTFQCRRMARFVHDRVIFAGDSAHLVSPFGARGCNGGVADVDNLGWKLDLILRGEAATGLLRSYDHEAIVAADENILNSTRSTDFMTPRTAVSRAFRDAVLELAHDQVFARPFVNSGRLSTAISYPNSPLNTPDADTWSSGVAPGSPALDAPVGGSWLLDRLGDRFLLLADGWNDVTPPPVEWLDLGGESDELRLARRRYDMQPNSAYLIRPDQYVAARWRSPNAAGVAEALRRATGA